MKFVIPLAGVSLLALSATARAQGPVDPRDLEARLVASQVRIWSVAEFEFTLDGCALHAGHRYLAGEAPFEDDLWIWLADLDTEPDNVEHHSRQLFGDSDGNEWWETVAAFQWRAEVAIEFADDIARWSSDYEAIYLSEDEPSLGGYFWEWLFPRASGYEAEQDRISAAMRSLARAMEAGEYGPFFTRNWGMTVGRSGLGQAYFVVPEMVISETTHLDDGVRARNSPLSLALREDEAEAILGDLHAYRLQACPD